MKLALDTNRYTDWWSGDQSVIATVEDAEEIYLPFIVLGELRAGFLKGTRASENEAALQRFLHEPTVRTLYPDDSTTQHYAAIYAQLRKQGTPLPTNDMWIAAMAWQHKLTLYARDKHFDHLPQLMRI